MEPVEPRPAPSSWGRGAARKLAYLGASRVATQVLGLLWFLIAARGLDEEEFGLMASGLAGFAAFTILADLGTTWSVPRHVAANPGVAWSAYRKALTVRSIGVVVVAVPVVLATLLFLDASAAPALGFGAAIALASGASEIGYATLRSLGLVRAEGMLLPAERVAFIAVAVGALALGAGAYTLLGIYLLTNAISAAILGAILWRRRREHPSEIGIFWDAEARRTGLAFTMLAFGPRLNALLLVLFGSVAAVSTYAVASRPVEQLALVIIGFATSMLPLLRSLEIRGATGSSDAVAGRAAEAVMVSLAAVVAWWIVAPDQFLRLLYGERYGDAGVTLSILAVVSVTWALRGVAGLRLIAGEHARTFVCVGWVGIVIDVVLGIVLIPSDGARGAAVALAASEVVMVLLLLWFAPGFLGRYQLRRYAGALGIAVGCGIGAWLLRDGPIVASLVNVGLWSALGAAVAVRRVQQIESTASEGAA
jgi:O-antigen/teichoic acid export membrane protein